MNPKNDRVSFSIPRFEFALERLFGSSAEYQVSYYSYTSAIKIFPGSIK